jgi:hypothetical protein
MGYNARSYFLALDRYIIAKISITNPDTSIIGAIVSPNMPKPYGSLSNSIHRYPRAINNTPVMSSI